MKNSIEKPELPAYNQEIEVTKEQYKKALRDLDGFIFHKQKDGKFYVKLGTSKKVYREQLNKIITA